MVLITRPAIIAGKRVDGTDTPTDNQVLTFDSATDLWQTENAGGGVTLSKEQDALTSTFSTTNNGNIDITGLSIEVATSTNKFAVITLNSMGINDSAGSAINLIIADDGTVTERLFNKKESAGDEATVSISSFQPLDGSTVTAQTRSDGAVSVSILGAAVGGGRTTLSSLEII